MQSLVYVFIAVAGLAVGAAAYFGLTFSPIEAFIVAFAFFAVAMLVLERSLRRRAEARLERGIEDLSRLLSTYAQAGSVLGQRVTALTEANAGSRLDAVEADMSVLGTVVRQVAEAMADLDDGRRRQARKEIAAAPKPAAEPAPAAPSPEPASTAGVTVVEQPAPTPPPPPVAVVEPEPPKAPPAPPAEPEPIIPLEMLKQALDENRLVFHLQPIVTLPQRKTHGYDLVPRLAMEEGDFADPPDFIPRKDGEAVIRRIERQALEEAITIARRARTGSQPTMLYVPLSRASLDAVHLGKMLALLDANIAMMGNIVLLVPTADWLRLQKAEKAALATITGKGIRLSLGDARSLRLDFAGLASEGVRSLRVDAQRFLAAPESFSDIHTADVTSYLKRFEVDLIATGLHTEDQILTLLEDGVGLASGPRIAAPGPIRPDLVASRPPGQKTPDRADA